MARRVDINIKTTADTTGAKQVEQSLGAIDKAAKRSADEQVKSQNRIRQATQNASFQLQDAVVQLEMGTDAARVAAQQVPQLLGGFGAAGAAAGAAIAIGSAAWGVFNAQAEAAKQKLENVLEVTKGWREEQKELQEELRKEAWQDYLKTLDDIKTKIDDNSQSLRENVELLAEQRKAINDVAEARDEEQIARIEADQKMPEDKRIEAVGKIRERMASRRKEETAAQIQDTVRLAEIDAEAARERMVLEDDKAKAIAKAQKEAEERQKRANDMMRGQAQYAAAAQNVKRLEDEMFGVLPTLGSILGAPFGYGGPSEEQRAQLKDARATMKQLEQFSAITPEKTAELATQANERAKALREQERQQREALKNAQREAELRNQELQRTRQLAEIRTTTLQETSASGTRAERIRREADIRQAQEKAAQDAAKAAERAEQQRLREQQRQQSQSRTPQTDVTELGMQAFAAARGLNLPEAGMNQLGRLVESMASNPSAQNAKALESMLEKVIAYLERNNVAASQQSLKIRQIEQKLEAVNANNKNNRPPGQ